MSHKCAHYGGKPKSHRNAEKLTATVVKKTKYLAQQGQDSEGNDYKLHQRQT